MAKADALHQENSQQKREFQRSGLRPQNSDCEPPSHTDPLPNHHGRPKPTTRSSTSPPDAGPAAVLHAGRTRCADGDIAAATLVAPSSSDEESPSGLPSSRRWRLARAEIERVSKGPDNDSAGRRRSHRHSAGSPCSHSTSLGDGMPSFRRSRGFSEVLGEGGRGLSERGGTEWGGREWGYGTAVQGSWR